jgi:hypothetical protein
LKSGSLNFLESYGLGQACNGIVLCTLKWVLVLHEVVGFECKFILQVLQYQTLKHATVAYRVLGLLKKLVRV